MENYLKVTVVFVVLANMCEFIFIDLFLVAHLYKLEIFLDFMYNNNLIKLRTCKRYFLLV